MPQRHLCDALLEFHWTLKKWTTSRTTLFQKEVHDVKHIFLILCLLFHILLSTCQVIRVLIFSSHAACMLLIYSSYHALFLNRYQDEFDCQLWRAIHRNIQRLWEHSAIFEASGRGRVQLRLHPSHQAAHSNVICQSHVCIVSHCVHCSPSSKRLSKCKAIKAIETQTYILYPAQNMTFL